MNISHETPKGALCDYLYGQLRTMVRSPDRRKLALFESNLCFLKADGSTGIVFFSPYYDRSQRKRRFYVNLGIPRGLAGGLLVFSYLYEAGFEKKRCGKIADGLARTLLEVNNRSPEYFPAFLGRVKKIHPDRNGWCYGDLSVGFALLQFGCIFDRRLAKEEGLKLFKRGLRRFLDSGEGSCLCHGYSGALCMAASASRIVRSKQISDSIEILRNRLKKQLRQTPPNEQVFLLSNAAARMCLTEFETGCSDWTERLLLLKNPFLPPAKANGG